MTFRTNVWMEAELALAAYASLAGGVATNSQIDALQEAGMSRAQAEEFARRYPTVVC